MSILFFYFVWLEAVELFYWAKGADSVLGTSNNKSLHVQATFLVVLDVKIKKNSGAYYQNVDLCVELVTF